MHRCRHPLAVYQSTRHTTAAMLCMTSLQRTGIGDRDERIVRRCLEMYERFFAERPVIADGHLHKLRYEELDRDLVRQVGLLYERPGLDGFGGVERALREHAERSRGHVRDRFPELPGSQRRRLLGAWRMCFDAWGYGETTDGGPMAQPR